MFAGERSRVERELLELRDGTTEESRASQQFHELTQHMSAQAAQEFKTLWFPELCPQEQEFRRRKGKTKERTRRTRRPRRTRRTRRGRGHPKKKQKTTVHPLDCQVLKERI